MSIIKDEKNEVAVADELAELMKEAANGNTEVLPQLQAYLDDNPEVWQKLGDLSWHAEEAVLGVIAGKHLLIKESVRKKMQELRAELSGHSTSPLEQLLIDRIVLAWAQSHHADMEAATHDRGVSKLGVHVHAAKTHGNSVISQQ